MRNLIGLSPIVALALFCISSVQAANPPAVKAAGPPAVKDALGPALVPKQPDVDYDVVNPKDYANCKVAAVRDGKTSGWVVTGPAGQTLRRFMDTNGDNTVDEWCYYHNGLEVYRDIDSNFNNKVDQCRWINIGGTRWGVDTNEDGRVDVWKMISPEEVSRVVVRALVTQDVALLTPLFVTKNELKALGIPSAIEAKITESLVDPAAKLKKASTGSKFITSKTTWMRFDGASPSVIPAEQLKTKNDIVVYENVMAIVQSGTDTGLVHIGELVRIGDVWKMTGMPQPLAGEGDRPLQVTAWGAIMDPGTNPAEPTTPDQPPTGISAATQKLVAELQELDKNAPPPQSAKGAIKRYTESRIALLTKIREASADEEERLPWLKQLVDTVAAPMQMGAYPEGRKQLADIEAEFLARQPKSPIVPYIKYRRMSAEYTLEMKDAESAKRQGVMDKWFESLEDFVKKYPKADDAPDAVMQLAVAHEFNGKVEEARTWYKKLVAEYGQAPAAERAKGALYRLDLTGTKLKLAGSSLSSEKEKIDVARFQGKTVLVLFWSTWCIPCQEDLPQIKDLYKKFHARGFEIVGVNLDMQRPEALDFLKAHDVPNWPQIFEPGGLESAPARDFGIISLPTMFLVDPEGKVVNRSASVDDIKEALGVGEKKKTKDSE